jgi:hypothetical protein
MPLYRGEARTIMLVTIGMEFFSSFFHRITINIDKKKEIQHQGGQEPEVKSLFLRALAWCVASGDTTAAELCFLGILACIRGVLLHKILHS